MLLGAGARAQIINPPGTTNREFFSLIMDGDFVVPKTATTNTGYVSLSYDYLNEFSTNGPGGPFFPIIVGRLYTNETVVTWRVKLETNFPAIGCGIYGPAMPGQSGPLLSDLGQPAIATNTLTVISWPNGASSFTNFSLDYVIALALTPDQMHQLEAGWFYVELASTNYPTGEMRVQVTKQPVLGPPQFDVNGAASFKVSTPGMLASDELSIEVSSNLVQWTVLTNISGGEWPLSLRDFEATNCPIRFYRGRVAP